MLVAKTSFSHHFNAVIFQLTEIENEPFQLVLSPKQPGSSPTKMPNSALFDSVSIEIPDLVTSHQSPRTKSLEWTITPTPSPD